MEWLSHNLGSVIILASFLLAGMGAWYHNNSRIGRLEEKEESKEDEVRELRMRIDKHIEDTTLHIDPQRDQRSWDDLKGEMRAGFERIEKKIERLMVYTPPPTA